MTARDLMHFMGRRWFDGLPVDLQDRLRALLADDGAAVEHRENIVEVYDHRGRYLGCMGIETWRRLLPEDGAARDERCDKCGLPRDAHPGRLFCPAPGGAA